MQFSLLQRLLPNVMVAVSKDSRTLHQQNLPVLNSRCQPALVDLYNGGSCCCFITFVGANLDITTPFLIPVRYILILLWTIINSLCRGASIDVPDFLRFCKKKSFCHTGGALWPNYRWDPRTPLTTFLQTAISRNSKKSIFHEISRFYSREVELKYSYQFFSLSGLGVPV